jgi:CheY-like chemotaxis protein
VSKRLLIIDDEPDIRTVAAASLQLVGGFTVISAGSGEEGLMKARQEAPDAIILDLMMPVMSGRETLQALKRDPALSCIPVILLTAKVHGVQQDEWQHAGAAGVLFKPFDPMKLAEQVSVILGWEAQKEAGAR